MSGISELKPARSSCLAMPSARLCHRKQALQNSSNRSMSMYREKASLDSLSQCCACSNLLCSCNLTVPPHHRAAADLLLTNNLSEFAQRENINNAAKHQIGPHGGASLQGYFDSSHVDNSASDLWPFSKSSPRRIGRGRYKL